MTIQERFKRVVGPTAPKDETGIADCIDNWLEGKRVMESMGSEYKLTEPCMFSALEAIMKVGKAKEFYELQKTKDIKIDELLENAESMR